MEGENEPQYSFFLNFNRKISFSHPGISVLCRQARSSFYSGSKKFNWKLLKPKIRL